MIPTLGEVKRNEGFDFPFVSKDKKINKKKYIDFVNKNLVADAGVKIRVGKLFFERFKEKEQKAILWHEFCHHRLTNKIEFVIFALILITFLKNFSILLDFFSKNIIWDLILIVLLLPIVIGLNWAIEFYADYYSATKNSVDDCFMMLKIIEGLYKNKKVKYHFITHPPIEKRIARIEKLKIKMENKK